MAQWGKPGTQRNSKKNCFYRVKYRNNFIKEACANLREILSRVNPKQEKDKIFLALADI